jgi:anti-sigma regulatory factor (Ser/Thr protein kinase)
MDWNFDSKDVRSACECRVSMMKHLRSAAQEDGLPDAELAIGEAIANTVEHAPGAVHTRVDWTSEFAVVTVDDAGPGENSVSTALPDTEYCEHGRGMFLMNALAFDVSFRPLPIVGSRVKFSLYLRRRPAFC